MGLKRALWSAALFAGACGVGAAVSRDPKLRLVDREVFDAMNAEHGGEADRVVGTVTEFGSLYAVGAASMTLFVIGRRGAALRAMTAATATWLLLQAMKKAVDRPRPLDAEPASTRQLIARPSGQSWPSSHPAVLTTFSSVAARELGVGVTGRAALRGLDATVAASRVYLGVHYPSDVISGLMIGRAVERLWPRRRA
jgi:undecaprenyl-diphosphatase